MYRFPTKTLIVTACVPSFLTWHKSFMSWSVVYYIGIVMIVMITILK